MKDLNKKTAISIFENYYDEIMSNDRSKFPEMALIIKSKLLDVSQKLFQNWSDEKMKEQRSQNTIIKDDETVKKK